MSRNKTEWLLDRAREAAQEAKGVGGRNGACYRLGAVVAFKGLLCSTGTNSYKTHPLLLKYHKYPYLHAEINAIIKWGTDNCKGAEIYVARVLQDGKTYALAKPCLPCLKIMKDVGIERVYYTTGDKDERGCIRL